MHILAAQHVIYYFTLIFTTVSCKNCRGDVANISMRSGSVVTLIGLCENLIEL